MNRTRRELLAAGAVALASTRAAAQQAAPTAAPKVVVRLLDCCGSIKLVQRPFDIYRRMPGSGVSRIVPRESPAAKMPERLKPADGSSGSAFDLVLTGPEALVDGVDHGLWLPLLPDHAEQLPDLEHTLSAPAWRMQELAKGFGVVTAFSPVGPLFNYMPARVPSVPRAAGELLEWALAHPSRFTYPVPTLSQAGEAFLMGLPYLLGDRDPADPERGWSNTWSYLQQLGTAIGEYAVSAGASFEKMKAGTLDMCVSSLPDDLASRMSPSSNSGSELLTLRDFHWVGSAYYAAIPRGAAPAAIPAVIRMIDFTLSQSGQAFAYGRGGFYPGPAIGGVPLSMAPADSRELIGPAERPGYAERIAASPIARPLAPAALQYALGRWSSQIARSK